MAVSTIAFFASTKSLLSRARRLFAAAGSRAAVEAPGHDAIIEALEPRQMLAADLGGSIDFTPATLPANGSIGYQLNISNTGDADANNTNFAVVLSTNNIFGDADDIQLQVGNRNFLIGENYSSGNLSVPLPAGLAPGNYFLLASVDIGDAVAENDETNNTFGTATASVTITEAVPVDLTAALTFIGGASTPGAAFPGGAIQPIITVTNTSAGGGTVDTDFAIRVVASLNDVYGDADDVELALFDEFFPINAGATNTYTLGGAGGITLPANIAPGFYRILVRADSGGVVAEADETNNTVVSTGFLTVNSADPEIANVRGVVTYTAGTTIRGQEITFSYQLFNDGAAPAANIVTRFFLSTDLFPGNSSDILLGEFIQVDAIDAAGSVNVGNLSFIVPVDTPAGTYRIVAYVDSDLTIPESNEGNNISTANGAAVAVAPDLRATLAFDPVSILPNGALALTIEHFNDGAAPSTPFSTRLVLSANNIFGDADDILLADVPVAAPIAAGESSASGILRFNLPANLPAGAYRILGRVDQAGAVAEQDETNNAFATAGADLTITALPAGQTGLPDYRVLSSTPAGTTFTPGQQVSIATQVRNTGTSAPGGTSVLRFVLSTNGVLGDADDIAMGAETIAAVAPGATATINSTIAVPGNAPLAAYRLITIVDANAQITESLENNNTLIAPRANLTVARPDLVVTSVTAPTPIRPGTNLAISSVVRNSGVVAAAPSVIRFVLSTNNIRGDADDVVLGTAAVGALNAGQSATVAASLTVPGGTAPGSFFVFGEADSGESVVETNENNNRFTPARANATIALPDLRTSFNAPNRIYRLGDNLVGTLTFQNLGRAAAPEFNYVVCLTINSVVGDADDIILTTGTFTTSLAAGATSSLASFRVPIPRDTPLGSYRLAVVTDPADAVDEANEANNNLVSTTQGIVVQAALGNPAAAGPDLTGQLFTSAATIRSGQSIEFTFNAANIGTLDAAAGVPVRAILSRDRVVSADDVVLSENALAGNITPVTGSVADTYTLDVPGFVASGTYNLILVVDPAATLVGENAGNRANNTIVAERANIVVVQPVVSVAAIRQPSEAVGAAPAVNGLVRFTRTGPLTQSLSAVYTVGGTATSGVDFTALNGNITFAPGQATVDVPVAVLTEAAAEGPETIVIAVGLGDGYRADQARRVATLTVTDNRPVVTATPSTRAAAEGRPFTVTLARTGTLTAAQVVTFTLGGTATAADYTVTGVGLTGPVAGVYTTTIPAGRASAVFTITPAFENAVEGSETIVVNVQPGAADAYGPGVAPTITVADVAATISVRAVNAREGAANGGGGSFVFTRAGNTSTQLDVTFRITGTAALTTRYAFNPADLQAQPTDVGGGNIDAVVRFAPGQTTRTVRYTVVDNAAYSAPETIIATLRPGSGPAAFNTGPNAAAATATITDNEPLYRIAATPASVGRPGLLTITRDQRTPANQDVVIRLTGNALFDPVVANSDYTIRSTDIVGAPVAGPDGADGDVLPDYYDITVRFLPTQLSRTVQFAVASPTAIEQGSRTLIASLQPSGAGAFGLNSENDDIGVSLFGSQPEVRVTAVSGLEGRTGSFTFTRTGARTGPAVTVRFILEGNAIRAGQLVPNGVGNPAPTLANPDYTVSNNVTITPISTGDLDTNGAPDDYVYIGEVTIPANQTTVRVDLTFSDDALSEGPESVVASIIVDDSNPATYRPSSTASQTTARATITDTDVFNLVSVRATRPAAQTPTGVAAQPGVFTISLNRAAPADLEITYGLAGTASAVNDYTVSPAIGTVTIPAGQRSATVTINPIANNLNSASETVILQLAGDPNYFIDQTLSSATVTIRPDNFSDLAVGPITFNPPASFNINTAGQTTAFSFDITNEGVLPSRAVTGRVVLARSGVLGQPDDIIVRTFDIPVLAPGASQSYSFDLDLDAVPFANLGTYRLFVVADPTRLNRGANFTNNTALAVDTFDLTQT